MALWHRLWCVPVDRSTVRETVGGVLGFRCECGHWEPAVARSASERERLTVTAPAHERLVTRKRRRLFFERRAS